MWWCLAHIKMRQREPVEKLDMKRFWFMGNVAWKEIHLCKKNLGKEIFAKIKIHWAQQKGRIIWNSFGWRGILLIILMNVKHFYRRKLKRWMGQGAWRRGRGGVQHASLSNALWSLPALQFCSLPAEFTSADGLAGLRFKVESSTLVKTYIYILYSVYSQFLYI